MAASLSQATVYNATHGGASVPDARTAGITRIGIALLLIAIVALVCVGIVDIDPAGPATVLWEAAAAGYQLKFASKVSIFRRQTTAGCATGRP